MLNLIFLMHKIIISCNIFAAQQLIKALKQNLALWIACLIIVVLCFFPFNYLTFDNVISHSQLDFFLFYIQILSLRHKMVGPSSLFTHPNFQKQNKSQILGLDLKIDLALFILLLIAEAYTALSNSLLFKDTFQDKLSGYTCNKTPSFYHNNDIAKTTCIKGQDVIIVYSKTSTFIYLYLLFPFTFRSASTVNKPLHKYNLLYFGSALSLVIILAQFCPSFLQLAPQGLSFGEYGVCFGAAASVFFACFLFRLAILYVNKDRISQLQLNLGLSKNQRAQFLKQYKFSQSNFFLEKSYNYLNTHHQ